VRTVRAHFLEVAMARSSFGGSAGVAVLLAGWIQAPGALWGQIPDKFTNLQVLSKDVSRAELVGIMRGLASDLGVRCHHCHVGPDDLKGMDFAIDTKPTKRAAREMIRMVQAINRTVKALPARDEARDGVTCYTCHRRQVRPPLPLHEEVLRTTQAPGVAAGVERYRELRRDHLGAGTYDFGPLSLGITARRLGELGRADDALALARENVAQHGGSADAHALLGDILLKRGDRTAALESFRKALELDPKNGAASRGLKQAEEADRR